MQCDIASVRMTAEKSGLPFCPWNHHNKIYLAFLRSGAAAKHPYGATQQEARQKPGTTTGRDQF